jgi:mono/diheme cytochrome c family protein
MLALSALTGVPSVRSGSAVAATGAAPAAPAARVTDRPTDRAIGDAFDAKVRPFVQTYCVKCHGAEEPEADLNLGAFESLDQVVEKHGDWALVLEMLDDQEMPPKKAKKHPDPEQRREIVEWIRAMRTNEARKNAGDPGPVMARRLNNAEYDYTIRDLTGVDLRPAREFPVDPANQAGFDNSGESLAMSPGLLKKYMDAAHSVAEHLLLKTDGFEFAPHPVVGDTDRDKYSVLRIVDFYNRQPTDLAGYFTAAWVYQNRVALGEPRATLEQVASERHVSARYLRTVWNVLTDGRNDYGPIARLRTQWREFPQPSAATARAALDEAQARALALRAFVTDLRAKLVPEVPNLTAPPIQNGSQTLVLWKDRQMAANRRRYDPTALHVEGTPWVERVAAEIGPPPEAPQLQPSTALLASKALNDTIKSGGKFIAASIVTANSSLTNQMAAARHRVGDSNLDVPADPVLRARHEAAFARFAQVFPDAFFISERARVYLDATAEAKLGGRLLSAGLHSMTGYFRDDGPLYDMVLDAPAQRELDRLWREFEFSASVPQRMHTSFLWFERTDSTYLRDAQFNPFRPEEPAVTRQDQIHALADLYLEKAIANNASPTVQQAIREHFALVAANIGRVEQEKAAAIPKQLQALLDFAQRAYRRPLTQAERADILAFYRTARANSGGDHEEAMRDSIVAVLMSPKFCYRTDMLESTATRAATLGSLQLASSAGNAPGSRVVVLPLSDHALASRLSYFLWATLPDAELLAHAAKGDLHRSDVLLAQSRRMLKDARVRNFAVEFVGNWLDFRRFEQHNAVDRGRFPSFDNALRESMFEEPVRFFVDLVQRDGPVLDFLYGDYTFVNAPLARHYGIPGEFQETDWKRIDGAGQYGRGGLLPMAVFLTANSPGLRTSPVKRGYWVVRRVLGEHIPAPPPKVPVLPADETQLGALTLRETLEKHRADPTCAACHARFDTFGLALEGYGAVGEQRTRDFGGHAIDAHALFPGGSSGEGLAGLRSYIHEHRERDFIDNLTRKLLAYGLGRTLLLSDEPLVDEMKAGLAAHANRIDGLIEAIVTSPQFRNRRAPAEMKTAGVPPSLPVATASSVANPARMALSP